MRRCSGEEAVGDLDPPLSRPPLCYVGRCVVVVRHARECAAAFDRDRAFRTASIMRALRTVVIESVRRRGYGALRSEAEDGVRHEDVRTRPESGGSLFRDMPIDELRSYRGRTVMPDDFRDFWQKTLAESRAAGGEVRLEVARTPLATVDTWDMTFPGFAGEPVRAWLRVPRGATGLLPAVVTYVGYGGGRGDVLENLAWASCGYVSVHMDVRGQGGTRQGCTPDPWPTGPGVAGVMTKGINDAFDYYYRRLLTDAVRAVDATAALPMVDQHRIAVVGGSQGGAQALAAAALGERVAAAVAFVPFLCDARRAVDLTDQGPYGEVGRYLALYRMDPEQVFGVLDYVDGVNFARISSVPVAMSVGLVDPIVPASTVFAAHNSYAGPRQLWVWPHNGHEGGGTLDHARAMEFLDRHLV